MDRSKRELLRKALAYCDREDKSDEFTIQYLQDYAKATLEEVMEYLSDPLP